MSEAVTHTEGVRQVREFIANGRQTEQDYRQRMEQLESRLWEMRIAGSYDLAAYMRYEAVVNVIREALGIEPFPPPSESIFPEAQVVQALEHGYTPPGDEMVCRNCGQSGSTGDYPFSTAPSTGLCDDCL